MSNTMGTLCDSGKSLDEAVSVARSRPPFGARPPRIPVTRARGSTSGMFCENFQGKFPTKMPVIEGGELGWGGVKSGAFLAEKAVGRLGEAWSPATAGTGPSRRPTFLCLFGTVFRQFRRWFLVSLGHLRAM